jgi:periplasmic divalent cation tolerance protein
MARAGKFRIVLVTCGSMAEARKIAKAVVGKRLAACANIVGGTAESVYWWKGKVVTGRERLLLIKTSAKKLGRLEEQVRRLHSYEVPEFLAVEVAGGSRDYIAWMVEVLG